MSRFESRLAKLERGRKNEGNFVFYLEWHRAGQGKRSVCVEEKGEPGPKCYLEWPNNSNAPTARWTTRTGISKEENDAIHEIFREILARLPKEPAPSAEQDVQLKAMTNDELWAGALTLIGTAAYETNQSKRQTWPRGKRGSSTRKQDRCADD